MHKICLKCVSKLGIFTDIKWINDSILSNLHLHLIMQANHLLCYRLNLLFFSLFKKYLRRNVKWIRKSVNINFITEKLNAGFFLFLLTKELVNKNSSVYQNVKVNAVCLILTRSNNYHQVPVSYLPTQVTKLNSSRGSAALVAQPW